MEFTFTGDTSDLDSMSILVSSDQIANQYGATGAKELGPQILMLDADTNTDGVGDTLVIEVVLCDEALTTVYARHRATGSWPSTAKRTDNAGTAGAYIVNLVFDESGTNKLDLNRGVPDNTRVQWRIGAHTLTNIGTVKVRASLIRAI